MHKRILSAASRSNARVTFWGASASQYCLVKNIYSYGELAFTWGVSAMTAGLAHKVGNVARWAVQPTVTALNSVCVVILSICVIGLEVGGGYVGAQLGGHLWDMVRHV